MDSHAQRPRAEQFRALHHSAPMLVLPNIWDAASARVIEQAGFPAVATTSGGVALALGYQDGQRMPRELMIEAIGRIARVVTVPLTADIEAGYGANITEVVETVRAVIATGAVGFNIEDSTPGATAALVDMERQVELIVALRALAVSLDIPFVINARVDVFLRNAGDQQERVTEATRRANAYLEAGADCAYPIGALDAATIQTLVATVHGPLNIMGGPTQPPLADLARYGVARVSLASGVMRASLGHLRAIARDIKERGDYTRMASDMMPSAEAGALFPE